jgi:branched-chain amino acid transport system ATP-binding protein
MLLEVQKLSVAYGKAVALENVSLDVAPGEFVAVLGPNGAGKSTLLKAISRACPSTGTLRFAGESLQALPAHAVVGKGICHCPEGRRLFPDLTVEENLLVAGRRAGPGPWRLDTVLDAFPALRPLRGRLASRLSGGQQQATAIARALMTNPRLLLVDEVSLGLSPKAVEEVYASMTVLHEHGTTVILVEQDLSRALSAAARVICLLEGRIVLSAPTGSVTRDHVTAAYFGLHRSEHK